LACAFYKSCVEAWRQIWFNDLRSGHRRREGFRPSQRVPELKQPEKVKLTKRSVEEIQPPEIGERIVWDEDLTGFGVRVSSRGCRTYFICRRTKAGRQIKMKIGVHGKPLTAETACEKAKVELGKIDTGGDPAEEKRQDKAAEAKRLAIPTVAQLCDRYLRDWAEIHKRPISIRDDRAMIEKIIKPKLGAKRVPDVEREDIASLHRSLKPTPFRANRVLVVLSKMFSLAVVDWKHCSQNPVKGIQRFEEQTRERYLSPDELSRLADALAKYPSQATAGAIRLLLLTGVRRSEVLTMIWEQLDRDHGVWIKPAAHTKTRREHRVPLSPGALEIIEKLRERRKPSDPFVFPGRSQTARPAVELKACWQTVTKAAGIAGRRLHDCRHTYASLLVNSGHSLPLIGALLGHTQTKTTQRYAHLADAGRARPQAASTHN
jgi:integrase